MFKMIKEPTKLHRRSANKGFGLLDGVFGAAILSLISVSMFGFISYTNKKQTGVRTNMDFYRLISTLETSFQNPDACASTFGVDNTGADMQTYDSPSLKLYFPFSSPKTLIATENMLLKGYKLNPIVITNVTHSPDGTRFGYVHVEGIRYDQSANPAPLARDIAIYFQVETPDDPNSKKIVACTNKMIPQKGGKEIVVYRYGIQYGFSFGIPTTVPRTIWKSTRTITGWTDKGNFIGGTTPPGTATIDFTWAVTGGPAYEYYVTAPKCPAGYSSVNCVVRVEQPDGKVQLRTDAFFDNVGHPGWIIAYYDIEAAKKDNLADPVNKYTSIFMGTNSSVGGTPDAKCRMRAFYPAYHARYSPANVCVKNN